jgi:ubiquitin thioesterase protein OTUB1
LRYLVRRTGAGCFSPAELLLATPSNMLQHQPIATYQIPHPHLQDHFQQQQLYHPQPHNVYAPQFAYQDDTALLTGSYHHSLQLPVQHSRNHVAVAAEQQQQLALAQQQQAIGFQAPNSRLHRQHPPNPHRARRLPTQQQPLTHPNMAYEVSEEELAQMQQASAGWSPEVTVSGPSEPTDHRFRFTAPGGIASTLNHLSTDHDPLQGPLVAERQPTTNITNEYAQADPIYQAKTVVGDAEI